MISVYFYFFVYIFVFYLYIYKESSYAYVNKSANNLFISRKGKIEGKIDGKIEGKRKGKLPIRNIKLKEQNENGKNLKPYIVPDIITYFKNIRTQFPFFQRENCPVYFDNAATTQKPKTVIERIDKFYKEENANIHRGIYKLSAEATNKFENVRDLIQSYIKCDSREEIIFTNGATHGFNLVSEMIMDKIIKKKKDEILLTYLEHHSNIIPWQEKIKKYKKGTIKYIELNKKGFINIKKLQKQINENSKILSFSHVSNVIGNIQNIKLIIKKVKQKNPNIIIILDAAQSFVHTKYNFQKMKAKGVAPDILITSIHKSYGPLGTGFIYINQKITNQYQFKPLLYGGNIITDVSKYQAHFISSPQLFETGTPNVASVLSMGTLIQFLNQINWKYVSIYEMYLYDLLIYYLEQFLGDQFVQLPFTKEEKEKQENKKENNKRFHKKWDRIHNDMNKEQQKNHLHVINTTTDVTSKKMKLKMDGTDYDNNSYEHTTVINDINTNEKKKKNFFLYAHNVRRLGLKKVAILPLWSSNFSSFDIATFLDFQNICIRAGKHCAFLIHKYFLKVPDTARISICFYNTPEEILYLAKHIASVSKMLSTMKQ